MRAGDAAEIPGPWLTPQNWRAWSAAAPSVQSPQSAASLAANMPSLDALCDTLEQTRAALSPRSPALPWVQETLALVAEWRSSPTPAALASEQLVELLDRVTWCEQQQHVHQLVTRCHPVLLRLYERLHAGVEVHVDEVSDLVHDLCTSLETTAHAHPLAVLAEDWLSIKQPGQPARVPPTPGLRPTSALLAQLRLRYAAAPKPVASRLSLDQSSHRSLLHTIVAARWLGASPAISFGERHELLLAALLCEVGQVSTAETTLGPAQRLQREQRHAHLSAVLSSAIVRLPTQVLQHIRQHHGPIIGHTSRGNADYRLAFILRYLDLWPQFAGRPGTLARALKAARVLQRALRHETWLIPPADALLPLLHPTWPAALANDEAALTHGRIDDAHGVASPHASLSTLINPRRRTSEGPPAPKFMRSHTTRAKSQEGHTR